MHDPLVVAFEIRRPWPEKSKPISNVHRDTRWRLHGAFWKLAGREFYWPSLITVWHREPGGHDALTVCRTHVQRPDGTSKATNAWRWHIHHWRLQCPPLQEARRRLLTRCTWCGGRSRKGDPVNVSHQWDGPHGHWWQGEPGLYHDDCSAISSAHQTCICEDPILDHDTYGSCARCGRRRSFGMTEEHLERARELNKVPAGGRRGDS